eukprot:gene1746-3374_t
MRKRTIPDQHKLVPGWQEPGLWRPKWIMDRYFDETDDTPAYSDRILFRLKPDRTMKVFSSKTRPIVQISALAESSQKKKKLFETPEDESKSSAREEEVEEPKIDGTWHWQDAAPLPNQAKVKLETNEPCDSDDPNGPRTMKVRHDTRCEWGKLDGYAAKFKRGKILKYRSSEGGLPLGMYNAGTFIIRVSPHRPLVAKDFLAFQ